MAKGSNNVSGRRSHGGKPYDPNNSFVKKVATKVTDLIPQRSWISKWFNSSEDNGEVLNNSVNAECEESTEEVQQAPPAKRPRIRMDVIHPPGTFNIQLRNKSSLNKVDETKDFSNHDETNEDFLEPLAAGPSGLRRLVSSTPAVQNDVRNTVAQRSNLNSLNPTQDNGVINEADDNSESSESTSGCSSLIPQNNRQEAPSNTSFAASFTNKKRFMDDNKMNYTNHLQSPRSLFLDTSNRDSLSSRRPSFNSSIMSNNLERSSTLASPFYSGNVTFGGANAAGLYKRTRSLFNSNNEYKLKVPRRTNVQVKPFNNGNIDSSGMSQTAKRILDALEHFSSPVLDAKKIPIKNATNLTNSGGMKRPREEVVTSPRVGLRHRTQQLMVPTVPDLLKIRRRQRLQDTTLAARNIVSAHSAPPITTPSEYRIRTDTDDDLKFRGKLRVKSKTNPMDEETLEPVNLPTIALPISTLPRFDIALPQYTKPADRSIDKDDSFKFASPIKVTSTTKSLSSVTDFTFSNPINPNAKQIVPSELNSSSRTLSIESNDSFLGTGSATNFMWSGSTAPRPKEKASFKESMPTATVELKSGSVVDFLKELNNKNEVVTTKDGEKENEVEIINSKMDSWECSECLIRNESSTHCTACKSSKPGIKAKEPPRVSTTNVSQLKPIENDCFGSQFKLSSDQWECSSCLVRNKQSAEKCVSCMSAKPGAAAKIKSGVESDLLKKFKPASDSWECSGCMVRNNGNVTTCPCCSTAKPGQKQEPLKSFDGFKQSSSTWECPCCMVRNADNVTTCPCCKAVKPGSAKKPEETPKTSALGFGDKFKTPAGSWSCDACLVSNKADATECIACTSAKPGTEKTTTSSSGSTLQFSFGAPAKESSFKFGIDKTDVTEPSNSTGFTFGMKPATTSTEKFTFGIPSTSESKTTTTTTTTGFTFGNSNKTTDDSVAVTNDKPTFSFGIPKAEEKKKEPTVESTEKKETFTFGGSSTETKTTPSGTTGGFKFGSPATKRPADNDDDSKIKKTIFGETNSFTAVVTSSQPSSTPSFSFTSSPAVSPPSVTAVTAATLATTTTAAATTTASLPQFGNATFTFSDQSKSTNFGIQSSTTLNTFSFGGSKPTEAAPAAEKKPLLSFPTTAFGSPNISTTPFGKTEQQPPVFGNIEKKPLFTAPEKVLAFGEKETFGTPDKTITSGFGGSSTAPPLFPSTAAAAPPSFGTSTTPSPFGSSATIFANNATTNNSFSSPSTTSVFSKPNESENSTASAAPAVAAPPPAASNLFTFGSSTPAASSGGFNFSAGGNSTTPAAAAKAPPSLFGFGAAANTTQAGNSFGGSTFSTSTTAPAQAGFSFNAPKAEAPPAFGQTVPPPAFGATQQQQQPQTSFSGAGTSNAGFNFGSAAPPSAATGGFNFGGMNQTSSPAPPSGGFNFNAPNSVSFNFTGGNQPTTFNATPKLPIPPNQRKIKTARRRMTPR